MAKAVELRYLTLGLCLARAVSSGVTLTQVQIVVDQILTVQYHFRRVVFIGVVSLPSSAS